MAGADVEALSRSFRSRIWLLVLLLGAGLGAALWSGTREAGIGAAEDRRQLLVVTGPDSRVDYHAVLEQAGFEIEVDDYDDWLAEARAAAPDSEAEGVALLLEHADRRGFALVVLEDPGARELAGLELEPAPADIEDFARRDYAALSVGDYAFPHRLSVDSPGEDPVLRLPGYGALEAVFGQELIGARADRERPTVEELQFEAAIARGREMFAGPRGFAERIAATRASVAAELDDGSGARSLVPPLHTGTAIPTPDGGVLVVHHALEIYSDNARSLDLEPAAEVALAWIGPEALAAGFASGEFERQPCASLAGAVVPLVELPGVAVAIDGSAIAIGSGDGDTIVWRKRGPGCDWAPVAELERRAGLMLAPRFEPGRSVAARVEQGPDAGRVLIYALPEAPATGEPPAKLEPGALVEVEPGAEQLGAGEGARIDGEILLAQAGRRLASLAFLDDRHLLAASERILDAQADADADAEARVLVLDRDRPGLYLSVPVDFFAAKRRIRELLVLAGASADAGPELLIAAVNRHGRAELIRLRIAGEAWAEFVAQSSPAKPAQEFGVEGRMVSLTPAQLDAEILVELDEIYGVGVSDRALIYAAGDRLRPSELALVPLDGGAPRSLTDNSVRDYLPRFGPDGEFATFVSLARVSISAKSFSVPRVLRLHD